MRRLGLVAGILMLAVAVPAVAQQVQGQPQRQRAQQARARQIDAMYQRLDKDHNGSISVGEWPRAGQAFARLDANSDGVLSKEELRRAATPRQFMRQQRINRQTQRRVRRMDANRDRAVSREEWRGKADLFDRIDADKDGKLTAAEIRQSRTRRVARAR